jgi:hypothetical protein
MRALLLRALVGIVSWMRTPRWCMTELHLVTHARRTASLTLQLRSLPFLRSPHPAGAMPLDEHTR